MPDDGAADDETPAADGTLPSLNTADPRQQSGDTALFGVGDYVCGWIVRFSGTDQIVLHS